MTTVGADLRKEHDCRACAGVIDPGAHDIRTDVAVAKDAQHFRAALGPRRIDGRPTGARQEGESKMRFEIPVLSPCQRSSSHMNGEQTPSSPLPCGVDP